MRRKGRFAAQAGSLPVSSVHLLIFRGLMVALFSSFLFLVIFTAAVYFSPLSEAFVPYLIFGGTFFCILIASIYVGKRTEEKGWLRGGLTGLIYVLTLLILGFILQVNIEAGFNIFSKLFLGFFFGAIGGIVGINS